MGNDRKEEWNQALPSYYVQTIKDEKSERAASSRSSGTGFFSLSSFVMKGCEAKEESGALLCERSFSSSPSHTKE